MAQQFVLAEAFVEFRARGIDVLNRKLSKVRTIAGKATGALFKMARAIKNIFTGKFALLGGVGIAAFIIKLLSLAANSQEAGAKLRAVFGDMSKDAEKWANDLARSIGRGRGAMQLFVTDAASLLKGGGFATKEALAISKIITQLTLDLAAFQNRAEPDVFNALTGALTGNRVAMKRLGVVLGEAELKAALLRLKFKGTWKEATTLQQRLAVLNAILFQTKDAQGQAAREAGGLMGQWRRFTGVMSDLGAAIGSILAPAVTELLDLFSEIALLIESNREAFKKWGEAIGAAMGKVLGPIKFLLKVMREDFDAAWNLVKTRFDVGFKFLEERVRTFIDFLVAMFKHAAKQAATFAKSLLPGGPEFKPKPFAFGEDDLSIKTIKSRDELAEAMAELGLQIAVAKFGLAIRGLAGGDPADRKGILQGIFDALAGGGAAGAAEKKKGSPAFEFNSFAGLWKASQTKLGKEEEKLVEQGAAAAVARNNLLKAVQDIPLARWA